MAARLAAGGWIARGEATAQIEAAGLASGLKAAEVSRAIRNGTAHGAGEGAQELALARLLRVGLVVGGRQSREHRQRRHEQLAHQLQ